MKSKFMLSDLIAPVPNQHISDDQRRRRVNSSYSDVLYRILKHQRWGDFTQDMIAGMTVSGFRLVVDRRLTAESISAYNWMAENFVAADFIGVTASQAAGFSFEPTFPMYQKQALHDIKASINRGVGAILWHNQFVIAAGYDDTEQLIYLCDCEGQELQPLPYHSFGKNESPYWYYQVLESHQSVDVWEVCKESLIQAVYKWETHDYMLPPQDYACGAEAYTTIAAALQSGTYDTVEAAIVLRYYAKSRQDIASYVAALEHLSIHMDRVISEYALLAEHYSNIVEVINDYSAWDAREPQSVQKVIEQIQRAGHREQQAIDAIKNAFPETIGNRFADIGLR